MADRNLRAGTINVAYNGIVVDAVGVFTHNLGFPLREDLVGSDKIHGYTEKPQMKWIEGEIRDASDFDLAQLMNAKQATITLDLANGKSIMLGEAWYSGSGDVETEEAKIPFKFCGKIAEEIAA